MYRYLVLADYEAYLERMAAKGWHVDKVRQRDALALIFTKGEPRKYRYVFDFNPLAKPDYKPTFEEFGWTYMGTLASCRAWRKEYTGERPQIHTDRESLQRRNKSVRNVVAVSELALILVLSVLAIFMKTRGDALTSFQITLAVSVMVFLIVYFIYGFWVIRKLQNSLRDYP